MIFPRYWIEIVRPSVVWVAHTCMLTLCYVCDTNYTGECRRTSLCVAYRCRMPYGNIVSVPTLFCDSDNMSGSQTCKETYFATRFLSSSFTRGRGMLALHIRESIGTYPKSLFRKVTFVVVSLVCRLCFSCVSPGKTNESWMARSGGGEVLGSRKI